jgi:serine/threonine-protein kinase CHEK2
MSDDLNIRVCDFGIAGNVRNEYEDQVDGMLTNLCGTPSCESNPCSATFFDDSFVLTQIDVAPEVLSDNRNRRYSFPVDVWSAGVVLYICLCGFPPFSDELYSKDYPYTLAQQIKSGRFDYPSPYWDPVGDPALDLIDSMIVVDPGKRLTAAQCLQHPWLTEVAKPLGSGLTTGGE